MKIGVFGPRDKAGCKGETYDNFDYVARCLEEYEGVEAIISGGGDGVEKLALRYADASSITPVVIPPNIQRHGTYKAFQVRNTEIVEKADLIVLFWNGKDRFYYTLLEEAVAQKKPLHLLHVAACETHG